MLITWQPCFQAWLLSIKHDRNLHSVFGEIAYRKKHNVTTKLAWFVHSIAKVWDQRGLLQLMHFFFLLTVLNLLWENEGVFLNPGEKWESLSVYRCLSFSQNTQMTVYVFWFPSERAVGGWAMIISHLPGRNHFFSALNVAALPSVCVSWWTVLFAP